LKEVVIRTTRLKNHFRPKPQEIFKGKNLNRKTNVEGKTIGQEENLQRGSSKFRHPGEIRTPRMHVGIGDWFIL
jgi:hypothetical protein